MNYELMFEMKQDDWLAACKDIDKLEAVNKKLLDALEVMRGALEELVGILDDPEARKEVDSFTSQPAKEALKRCDEVLK